MPITNDSKETTLKYRVDARGLRDLKRETDRAFDPKRVRDMRDSALALKSTLRDVAREQSQVALALAKTAEGTAAYKALEKQLDRTEARAKNLRNALTSLHDANKADPRKGSFAQGLAQGAFPGVSTFLQRDEGMRRQFAGQMVGGAARRAGGAAGAMVGGQGPLSAMLGNLPLIGGAAQAAEQAVQRAVSFQQAQMEAMPFVGGFGKNERAWTETVKGKAPSVRMTNGGIPDVSPGGGVRRAAKEEAQQKIVEQAEARWRLMPTDSNHRAWEQAKESQAKHRGSREGVEVIPGTPDTKTLHKGTLDDYYSAGNAAFLTREQTAQAAGQYGRTVGRGASATEFGQVEAARVTQGVDSGIGAGIFRQLRAGRGGSDSTRGNDALAGAIGDATRVGLEGSEISEYLEQLVSLQEHAAQQGVKITGEGFGAVAGAMRGMGFEGTRGAQIAGQFAGAGASLAQRGASGAVDVALLRSLGFDPSKGGDSYVDAMLAGENMKSGSMDPETILKFVSSVTGGKGGKSAGLSLNRALGELGVKTSLRESIGMADAASGGPGGFGARLQEMGVGSLGEDGKFRFSDQSVGSAGDLTAALSSKDVQEWGGLVKQQIAVENNLLTAGQNAAQAVMDLQMQFSSLAGTIGKLSQTGLAEKVVGGVVTISENIEGLIQAMINLSSFGQSRE